MHVFAYFRSRNPDALNLLIKLFIERSHSLWKVPEVSTAARIAKKRYHGVSTRAYLIISICTVNVAICDMSFAHTDTSMNRGTQYAHIHVCMLTTTHTYIMYSSNSC